MNVTETRPIDFSKIRIAGPCVREQLDLVTLNLWPLEGGPFPELCLAAAHLPGLPEDKPTEMSVTLRIPEFSCQIGKSGSLEVTRDWNGSSTVLAGYHETRITPAAAATNGERMLKRLARFAVDDPVETKRGTPEGLQEILDLAAGAFGWVRIDFEHRPPARPMDLRAYGPIPPDVKAALQDIGRWHAPRGDKRSTVSDLSKRGPGSMSAGRTDQGPAMASGHDRLAFAAAIADFYATHGAAIGLSTEESIRRAEAAALATEETK